MRRRIREAYRLNRQLLQTDDRIMIDLAFIYVASDLTPYRNIDNAMRRLLRRIAESQETSHPTTADETVASD